MTMKLDSHLIVVTNVPWNCPVIGRRLTAVILERQDLQPFVPDLSERPQVPNLSMSQ